MKLLLVICTTTLVLAQAASDKKVVCYWGSWSVYRTGDGGFDLSYLDPKLCTHMIYTFVGLSLSDEVVSLDPYCDFSQGGGKNNIARLNQLREQNPDLKTMVAIGGWKEGSAKYSQLAADPSRRRKFIESAVAFVKKYGFDGFDVDWEYPAGDGCDNGGRPIDRQNYVLLLKELRERFDQEGLLLSAAVGAPESIARVSYDIPQMSKYLDFINIMAYDLYGDYSKTGNNAALYPASSESGNQAKLNIDSIVNYWLSQGAPSEKIVLGVPLYGRSFTLSNPQSNGVGAPSSSGAAGPYTKEAGMLGYNEICEKFMRENWNLQFDEECRVPYAFNGNQWISYDDQQSIKEKADLIKRYNLGGGMVWSIETDDFLGKCGENFPLLKALNSELRNGASSSVSVSRPKGEALKSKPEQPQYQPDYYQQYEPNQYQQYEPNQFQQYEPNQFQQYEPSYAQPDYPQQYEPSYAQPEYPQQQPANHGQICQAEGLAKDPSNCSKFYICQYVNNEYISYSFDCPAGTLFSPAAQACHYADQVQC